MRYRVAQHDVTPAELVTALKTKLENPCTKPEVIVLSLELLYMACCRRKSDWDLDMQSVASLGAGKATLEWLWEDMDQWAAAITNFDFTKHLCFFLLAEGREHHVWEMLEHGELPYAPRHKVHAWRGILFRSLLSAKILIGHHLHQSIDDAISAFFVLQEKKTLGDAILATLHTSKYPAEVEILKGMQSPLSAKTNPVLWDMFCDAYTEPTLRVRFGHARRIAMMHLFHPTSPNPEPVLDYIREHFPTDNHSFPGRDSKRDATQFALAMWPQVVRVLDSQRRKQDMEWLSRTRVLHNLNDVMLQLPRQKHKPLSMEDHRFADQEVGERETEWTRVIIGPDDKATTDASSDAATTAGNWPKPLEWQAPKRFQLKYAFNPMESLNDKLPEESGRD